MLARNSYRSFATYALLSWESYITVLRPAHTQIADPVRCICCHINVTDDTTTCLLPYENYALSTAYLQSYERYQLIRTYLLPYENCRSLAAYTLTCKHYRLLTAHLFPYEKCNSCNVSTPHKKCRSLVTCALSYKRYR